MKWLQCVYLPLVRQSTGKRHSTTRRRVKDIIANMVHVKDADGHISPSLELPADARPFSILSVRSITLLANPSPLLVGHQRGGYRGAIEG